MTRRFALVVGGLIGYAVGYRLGVNHTILTVLAILPKDQARDFAKVFKHHLEKKTRVGSDS